MPTSSSDDRASLLAEIASLEASISLLTTPPRPSKRPRLSPPPPSSLSLDASSTLNALLRSNDHALSALLPAVNKVVEGDEEDEMVSIALEQAFELVRDNEGFGGVVFSEQHAQLMSVENNHQMRRHTLVGSLPSHDVPISFEVVLSVREPAGGEGGESGGEDPGRDYVVEEMRVEVWGGGVELLRAVEAYVPPLFSRDDTEEEGRLELNEHPNPPAFFALLRDYSRAATERMRIFNALRTRFPSLVLPSNPDSKAKGKSKESESEAQNVPTLIFSNPSSTLTLTLSHTLSLSPTSHLLIPSLSLSPLLSPSLSSSIPESSREVLEEVGERFDQMLRSSLGSIEEISIVLVAGVFGLS